MLAPGVQFCQVKMFLVSYRPLARARIWARGILRSVQYQYVGPSRAAVKEVHDARGSAH